jgi:succinate dehydrogenase flavin-adding protein (antitoxin of CptAB toxin-antitoxin module)
MKKLQWQCRRGTQELEQLLIRYLEREYLNATPAEQQDFQQLLDLEDSQLLELFFTEIDSDLGGLNYLIEKIRHCASNYGQ